MINVVENLGYSRFFALHVKEHSTGKSLSEALIYLSINPQYDKKLFNDLRVQYKKIPRAEHVKNKPRTCYLHKLF